MQTLAMDHKPQNKSRTSYFGNVKNRLGPKLPTGVSQPPQFTTRTWEVQPLAPALQQPTVSSQRRQQLMSARPLNHTPHIRNPKLRQYYLQGPPWEVNRTDVSHSKGHPGDTVFSVSSQFHSSSQTSSSDTLIPRELLVVPKEKTLSTTQEEPPLQATTKSNLHSKAKSEIGDVSTAHSPSPEAEYDKLLDVEAVPMPDGQLCLLALPPECCEGEGADATPYLKLFCRYITDCKGVVSGILLVTSNKLFFDPCKTHPLVKENGCEEYVLSCSVDSLASVSFYSDITHIHFNTSQQRRKGKTLFQKLKPFKSQTNHHPGHTDDATSVDSALRDADVCDGGEEEESASRDMAEVERELDSDLLNGLYDPTAAAVCSSAATFCCGGPEDTSGLKMEEETSAVKQHSTVCGRPSQNSPGSLMFVRLRAQLSAGRRRGPGVQLGSSKTLPRRDTWLALSQESSDELYAYLTQCCPDLCLLEGAQEEDEDEFVLIEDKEQVSEEEEEEKEGNFQRHRCSGEDWEVRGIHRSTQAMVVMDEHRERSILAIDKEPEGLQSIVERSHILEASHVKELCKELPPRTVGHTWKLTYSTSRHGSSLKSLYRKVSTSDSPALIIIKDALDEVFGAFLSHPLRPSEAFYGTGETFLFMLHPRFKCFRWTGENSFFIKGDLDSFAIGGGSGHFGLWVDENLYLGRSSPCYTFNNCCLSETDDFRIMELEVWTFG
ncbi:nuclear receptor coactivator 7 isoform X2 [Boleophthalmus pectinirostris]|uniref:nuclear receptor coactivator 7 isoform X2 n=1 Tax=Boleophthalmus pectinirostris TaxID=150288 RepID=UPI00242A71D2|nr:nuclear receptor coactivator 7 isoform X2 [Boleophthalmus pectinirostris]